MACLLPFGLFGCMEYDVNILPVIIALIDGDVDVYVTAALDDTGGDIGATDTGDIVVVILFGIELLRL